MHLHAVDEPSHELNGGVADEPTSRLDAVAQPRFLDPDARFASLEAPGYDPDAQGIRRGVAPTLSVLGGVLVMVSPLGAWLRVTRIPAEGAAPEVIHQELGRDLGPGIVVGVLGLAAVLAAALWNRRAKPMRRLAHLPVLAAAVMAGVALLVLQGRIGDASTAAIAQPNFFDLNAGAGWGAWAAIFGAALLLLASTFGLSTDNTGPGVRS